MLERGRPTNRGGQTIKNTKKTQAFISQLNFGENGFLWSKKFFRGPVQKQEGTGEKDNYVSHGIPEDIKRRSHDLGG